MSKKIQLSVGQIIKKSMLVACAVALPAATSIAPVAPATAAGPSINTIQGDIDVANINCTDFQFFFAPGSADAAGINDAGAFYDAMDTYLNKGTHNLSYTYNLIKYAEIPGESDNLADAIALKIFHTNRNYGDQSYILSKDYDYITHLANKISRACPETRFVFAGFGKGAALMNFESLHLAEYGIKTTYMALFSDPYLYLPEGEGDRPAACRGENLSDYRTHVPDCHAHKGILGDNTVYVVDGFEGRLGTWCNNYDYYCSSKFGYKDHFTYAENGIYDDAAKVIYAKMLEDSGYQVGNFSSHDTAILIDSTRSMIGLINDYKSEALRLASETLKNGGRVALYDYRDLITGYQPVKHCDFDTCTLELFESELSKIATDRRGNGDIPESVLSASYNVMQELNWRYGATKSVVILTDATYLNPDRDQIELDHVVALSKSIDPVNFYIVTNDADVAASYQNLASATDGAVVSSVSDAPIITNSILERYDSLPRVIEEDAATSPVTILIGTADELIAMADNLSTEDGPFNIVVLPSHVAETPTKTKSPVVIPKAPNTGHL